MKKVALLPLTAQPHQVFSINNWNECLRNLIGPLFHDFDKCSGDCHPIAMMKKTFVASFFALTFIALISEKSSATSFTCWDGSLVSGTATCPAPPIERNFPMFGLSTEGSEVSAYILDDQVITIKFTAYEEMGKTDYYITPSDISIRTTNYNMPFHLNGFDPEKSTVSSIENYRIHETETGDITVSGEPDEKNKQQSRRFACLIKAINNHVIGPENVLPPLQLNCD